MAFDDWKEPDRFELEQTIKRQDKLRAADQERENNQHE
jgi:hypothetical protein